MKKMMFGCLLFTIACVVICWLYIVCGEPHKAEKDKLRSFREGDQFRLSEVFIGNWDRAYSLVQYSTDEFVEEELLVDIADKSVDEALASGSSRAIIFVDENKCVDIFLYLMGDLYFSQSNEWIERDSDWFICSEASDSSGSFFEEIPK